MKKLEISIALVLGSVFGILGMLGVVYALKLTDKKPASKLPSVTATPIATESKFSVTSPIDFTSWNNKPLMTKGTAMDTGAIISVSETSDQWIAVPATLDFHLQIAPISGVNVLTFYETKRANSKTIHILNLPELPIEKTFEKGIVTDITAEYIQLKRETGIEQVGTSQNTKALNISKDVKAISLSEVAIGDTIYAVGDKNANGMSASFIVVANGDTNGTSKLHTGALSAFDKSSITITVEDTTEKLKFDSTTKLIGVNPDDTTRSRTKFIKDDIDSQIFAVETGTDSAKPVRTIFIKPTQ